MHLSYSSFEFNDNVNKEIIFPSPIPELDYRTAEKFVNDMNELDVYLFVGGGGHTSMNYLRDLEDEYKELAIAFRKKFEELLKKKPEWCEAIDDWEYKKWKGKMDVGEWSTEALKRQNELYVEAHLLFDEQSLWQDESKI